MKIGALSALGHNMADSLASGICFMADIYSVDIFGEAARSREGEIRVDFLAGTTAGSSASDDLKAVVRKFAELLPLLAQRNGVNAADIRVLSVRFGTDRVLGKHFSVTVEDAGGRRSVDQYVGVPGRRYGRARRSRVVVGTVAARESG